MAIKVTLRNCTIGEEYTADGKCLPCQVGYYSFAQFVTLGYCKKCVPEANCYGGAVVSPIPSYWRSNYTSENFIACPNSKACLGGNYT